MKQNFLETIVGAVVILVAGYFLYFAIHSQEHRKSGGYELLAQFSDVDGLSPGSAIRVSGVKVGTVSKIILDPNTFQATVHLEMASDYKDKIPKDTLASVTSPGLLGDKYMSLVPGNSDEKLKPGDMIADTQSSASLEALLGQVIFSLQNIGKSSSGTTPTAPGGTPGAIPPGPGGTAIQPADQSHP